MSEQFPQDHSGQEPEQTPDREATTGDTGISHEQEPRPNPLIYVASLADYEQGQQHGVWLYAASEPEPIYNDIHRMLAQSTVPGADRFAIRDIEGFGAFTVHETDSIELVTKVARGIREHGLAFALWAEVNEGSPELLDHFMKAYKGYYESLAAYGEQLMKQMGHETALDRAVPEDLRPYVTIDYEGVAQLLFLDGDIQAMAADRGGYWVFDERA